MITRVSLICFSLLWISLPVLAQQNNPANNATVLNSPHNMSISGPGAFRSLSTGRVCVFCHTPHSNVPNSPLWNRSDTGQSYIQYSSSTLVAVPGQPSASSRLCLACHDGTIALEKLSKLPSEMAGNKSSTKLSGRANLGTDLADDHPISFVYDHFLQQRNGQLLPPNLVTLPMDNGIVRCGTCHDPHDATFRPFLRLPSNYGELCTACHDPEGSNWNWETSAHATSSAIPHGSKPWRERKAQWQGRTVADNACFNCHTPHNAATPERLITDLEEATCYRCHDGSMTVHNLQAEFLKPSRHPVDVTPNPDHIGQKAEDPLRMRLHVECSDCHNPHGAGKDLPMLTVQQDGNSGAGASSPAPFVNRLMAGVTGISSSQVMEEADYQYEVCFKCHGVPGRSACANGRCSTARAMAHTRVDGVYNIRDKLDPNVDPSLISYHPIVQNNPFNNDDVPSLRTELGLNTTDTLIYCTDCHNSDESSAGSGSGAEGPHGSIYPPILAERYTLNTSYIGPGMASFEASLCFKCHDETQLKNTFTASGSIHSSHEAAGTCITCHDPHGSTRFKHLLNFETNNNRVPAGDDPRITGAGTYSEPTWIESADGGECWLNCHNSGDHLGASYTAGFENLLAPLKVR